MKFRFILIVFFFINYSIFFADELTNNSQQQKLISEEAEWYTLKTYSKDEKIRTCNQYEGKYIGYYDNIYYVEKCKRRKVVTQDMIQIITRKKTPIYSVNSDVVAMLDEGENLYLSKNTNYKKITLEDLNNKYITDDYINIFFVKNGVKYHIPDWETYVHHRKSNNLLNSEIIMLNSKEFNLLKIGKPIPSVLDTEDYKILSGQKQIEVIPITKACAGLEGKDVSFMDKIYKIEKCKKRAYDAVKYLKDNQHKKITLVELTSEQWLSLPNGKPMN